MKRNQQVKKISYIMILTLLLSVCSVAAVPSRAEAEVKPAAGKSYSETEISNENTNIWDMFVSGGKLRLSTQEWEQEVYGISGKKLVKKPKDPLVKATYNAFDFVNDKELETEFCFTSVNKKGTAGYFTNIKKIFKYDKKGKIKKVLNLPKKLKWEGNVTGLEWVNKDFVAVEFRKIYKKGTRILLVDMKKGKVAKKYNKKYTGLCGTDGKNLYVTMGSIEKKTEKIVKIKASSGKKLASISTAPVRELAAGWEDPYEYANESLRNGSFRTCYANGKLYMKYLTGIYTWNGKSKDFRTVLDGRNNANYASRQYWGELEVNKDKIYYLAGNGDDGYKRLYVYKAS